jgi:hypothetical protein
LYFEHSLHKFKSKPKKIWEIINQATGVKNSSTKINEISNGGQILTNNRDMAMAFNECGYRDIESNNSN